jgi:hypothetical protein
VSNPNDFDLVLKDLAENSIGKFRRLQTFDSDAFEQLYAHLELKADKLKSQSTISKQVLSVILDAGNVIAEAENNIGLQTKFSMLLPLLAINESPKDRVPGVPRII